jgi:metal-responsive CopG/Arc/MetJ family transcriptional regulator
MPTSVHLPRRLLDALDQRARRLGISRNRLIVRVLERELGREGQWSPGFMQRLTEVDPAVGELLGDIG